jgi:Rrf2 family cysteine metabolism transcriptional repressor
MKLSTNGRYTLRVMLDLAMQETRSPVSRQEIAARQQISSEFIAQLFRPLCKSNLVSSVMGPGGGYVLTQLPETIRIGDVIRLAEGPIAVVYCVQPGTESPCERIEKCPTHVIWSKLNNIIETYLDSITLRDLMTIAKDMEAVDVAGGCPDAIDSILQPLKINSDQPDCSEKL